ncbi:SMP-30/gluconolaconase/LRE-like protein [Streptomyces sp. Ag109_O5-1]|uniref:SMP-30/gluconolactonase/LRE family protein n=1 Tax=Streptomyces sp. Ag109_O5-1 TaxID=1938851 RepID=UPI000F4F0DE4|nr:SMP-30/gluconolactonase/LRE family protein [Streptomyces sp. Ag109_O5-1]RPE39142.1 SMP-30/gluconolaconase/LRE-like protein [Streptomyces sp. Ag109_O5-1]
MSKTLNLAAAAAAATAVFVSAPYASATAGREHPKPVVTDVKTVAPFDWSAGEVPENITVNPDSTLTVSMLGSYAGQRPELVRLSANGQHKTVLVTGVLGDGFTGNTRGSDGTIYYNVWSKDASRAGVWKLPPGGHPSRVAALPADGLPNGLAIDPAERTLYVTDSIKGTIWAVPVAGGQARAWLTDQALARDPKAQLSFGANGLRYHNGALWVTNFNKATLLRIPVTAAGKPGRIHQVTDGEVGIDDFNFLSSRSDIVFTARNTQNKVDMVYPNGTKVTVLTAADGLASPTATAVRGHELYITDAGLAAPHHAQLQGARINLARLQGR